MISYQFSYSFSTPCEAGSAYWKDASYPIFRSFITVLYQVFLVSFYFKCMIFLIIILNCDMSSLRRSSAIIFKPIHTMVCLMPYKFYFFFLFFSISSITIFNFYLKSAGKFFAFHNSTKFLLNYKKRRWKISKTFYHFFLLIFG